MSSFNVQSLLLLAVCAQLFALGLAGVLYPYGTEHGDSLLPKGDDITQLVPLAQPFKFYDNDYNQFWVDTNGVISFGGTVGFATTNIPHTGSPYSLIAPYMIDLITEYCDGLVYYREITSGSLLTMASNHVRQCNSGQSGFSANWVFIVTWDSLTYYTGDQTTPVVKFQVVLISDGTKSFVMFNYKNIEFSTTNHYVQMGFNKGDDVHYTVLPDSGTDAAINAEFTRNCGPSGRWFFKVDGPDVEFGGIFPHGVYNCDSNNPCTPANAAGGLFYFAFIDKTKYVQCSQWGSCYIRSCPRRLIFYPEYSVCSW